MSQGLYSVRGGGSSSFPGYWGSSRKDDLGSQVLGTDMPNTTPDWHQGREGENSNKIERKKLAPVDGVTCRKKDSGVLVVRAPGDWEDGEVYALRSLPSQLPWPANN